MVALGTWLVIYIYTLYIHITPMVSICVVSAQAYKDTTIRSGESRPIQPKLTHPGVLVEKGNHRIAIKPYPVILGPLRRHGPEKNRNQGVPSCHDLHSILPLIHPPMPQLPIQSLPPRPLIRPASSTGTVAPMVSYISRTASPTPANTPMCFGSDHPLG
jgi:hypothetical protein